LAYFGELEEIWAGIFGQAEGEGVRETDLNEIVIQDVFDLIFMSSIIIADLSRKIPMSFMKWESPIL
jgi:hypothetical protein